MNLKYLHQHRMINLNCLMGHILCLTFKIILSTFFSTLGLLKKHGEKTDRPSVQMYVNKVEKGLHLKLKKGIALNFQRQRQ